MRPWFQQMLRTSVFLTTHVWYLLPFGRQFEHTLRKLPPPNIFWQIHEKSNQLKVPLHFQNKSWFALCSSRRCGAAIVNTPTAALRWRRMSGVRAQNQLSTLYLANTKWVMYLSVVHAEWARYTVGSMKSISSQRTRSHTQTNSVAGTMNWTNHHISFRVSCTQENYKQIWISEANQSDFKTIDFATNTGRTITAGRFLTLWFFFVEAVCGCFLLHGKMRGCCIRCECAQ